jgi:hypothetical protein
MLFIYIYAAMYGWKRVLLKEGMSYDLVGGLAGVQT